MGVRPYFRLFLGKQRFWYDEEGLIYHIKIVFYLVYFLSLDLPSIIFVPLTLIAIRLGFTSSTLGSLRVSTPAS